MRSALWVWVFAGFSLLAIMGLDCGGNEETVVKNWYLYCLDHGGESANQSTWPVECFPDELGPEAIGTLSRDSTTPADAPSQVTVRFTEGVVSSVNGMDCAFCSKNGQPEWSDRYEPFTDCSQWVSCGEDGRCSFHLWINAYADPPKWRLTGSGSNDDAGLAVPCPEFADVGYDIGYADVDQPCFGSCSGLACGYSSCGDYCGNCQSGYHCTNGTCYKDQPPPTESECQRCMSACRGLPGCCGGVGCICGSVCYI